MDPTTLPIYELESALIAGIKATGRVIVQAPTGSGKSTQIPKMLLAHGIAEDKEEIVVLQPRRLAARLLAKRVAEELKTTLGDLVGYQIRLDSKVSNKTRIRFVTEGILLRSMAFDPYLKGVKVVVFDEFHERHLYGDISLARAKQIQETTRPDLKIVVMSATLETSILKGYLAPCSMLTSQGRSFPVRIDYLKSAVTHESSSIWDVACEACEQISKEATGDILIFMPGAYEISRTVQALQSSRNLRDYICFPLHGELSAEAQDKAVAQYDTRKIIVSTNVAETSLTIDGVTAIIDSGLARISRFDSNRGINTLLVEKISAASADQRAGRAGRTAPGICLRLWTEKDHTQRALQELPEIKRLDLSEVVLTLKSTGIKDIVKFPWLEKPELRALEQAETLLKDLGALAVTKEDKEGDSSITELGLRMLKFPVHPRYARMFIAADERGCVRSVALMAALTQGRSFLLRNVTKDCDEARETLFGEEHESDFFLLMRAWRYAEQNNFSLDACKKMGIHAQGARQVGPLFEQFLEIAKKENLELNEQPAAEKNRGEAIRKCVLAGFSDQLARRLDAGTLRCELVHKRKGLLARESAIQKSNLFVASEITEVGGRDGEVNVLLNLATAIEESWLKELFPNDFLDIKNVTYDLEAKRVVARKEKRFRDLILESRLSDDIPLDKAAQILTQEVVSERIKIEAWNESVEQWIIRVNRLAEWFPELEVNVLTPSDRATLIEQICYGETSAKEVRNKEVMPTLLDWLTAEQLSVLDIYLPSNIKMANGRKATLSYTKNGPPVLSARIQELYSVEGKFSLGQGRVPVTIEVLAPNHRPIQVTDDLTRFWADIYPKIKGELSRKYPRHEWR
jgi:ATP-dependent helicase HrpB